MKNNNLKNQGNKQETKTNRKQRLEGKKKIETKTNKTCERRKKVLKQRERNKLDTSVDRTSSANVFTIHNTTKLLQMY